MSDLLPVFVYGTLRTGLAGFAELGLVGRVTSLGPARVAGTLYDLGDYPGALLTGEGLIEGELLALSDTSVLHLLDEYELFTPENPAGSEYIRVPVLTEGEAVNAWIYVYNFPLEDARLIVGGNWNDR